MAVEEHDRLDLFEGLSELELHGGLVELKRVMVAGQLTTAMVVLAAFVALL